MAAGLPVVAVDATGTRDVVIDGLNGWLTENSSLALAEGIKKILDGAELRKFFADKSTEQIQRYDIRLLTLRLVEVYKQAEEDQAAGRTIQVERLTRT
jgi:glycosyltransferase involved in cell wall biosynthesis